MQRQLRSNSTAPPIFPLGTAQTMADDPATGGGAPAPPVPPVEVWTENPLTGNFNPGTTSGQKIFLEKTKGLAPDKRLALTNSNAQQIMEILKVKEQVMGSVITFVPTAYAAGTGIGHKNLISQSPSISLEACQRAAFIRFATQLGDNDPIPDQPWTTAQLDPGANIGDKAKFYDRVNGNVVVELLKNIFTPGGFEDLMLQSEKFTFTNTAGVKSYDGPTMLKVALEEIDPTASVNIEMHRQSIEGAKLHDFKNNVVEMIKSIEKHHQAIVGNGHKYDQDTYRRHLMTALLSGSNAVFNTKMQQVKGDIDACYGFNSDITPSSLITMAKQLYVNIDRRSEWNKVDPRDAQIMALTTKLQEKTSTQPLTPVGSNTDSNNAKMTDDEFFNWRKTFKGASVERQGKTWDWCPHHKKEGHYDGLYYSNHTAETHEAWKAKGKRGGGRTPPPTPTNGKASLKISDTLKNALCTNLCVSEEDLAKIIDSAESEN